MQKIVGSLKNYMTLSRLPLLPTCWSNVLLGTALVTTSPNWTVLLLVALAISLFYIGGMALNDVVDVPIDLKERPDRLLPSGIIPYSHALLFALACLIGGSFIIVYFFSLTTTVLAFFLLTSIVLYDLFHKQWASTSFLMGICRGLVYLIAASAMVKGSLSVNPLPLYFAVLLTLYIMGITLIARLENESYMDKRKIIAIAIPIAIISFAFLLPQVHWSMVVAGGIPLFLWFWVAYRAICQQPPQTKKALFFWIAGISLIDAYFLLLLENYSFSLLAMLCFLLTLFMSKKLKAI